MAENTEKAEAKAAGAGKQSALPTVKVTFARDFTLTGIREDRDGETVYVKREYKNGDTADIPAENADQVLLHGHARPHDAGLARIYGFPEPQ